MTVEDLEKVLSKIKNKSLKVVVSLDGNIGTVEIFEGIEFGRYHEGMALFTPVENESEINAIRLDCRENEK